LKEIETACELTLLAGLNPFANIPPIRIFLNREESGHRKHWDQIFKTSYAVGGKLVILIKELRLRLKNPVRASISDAPQKEAPPIHLA